MKESVKNCIQQIKDEIKTLDESEAIEIINTIKSELHDISPFKNEPVDCVLWLKSDEVKANDYNPNKVAPPEMELLEVSILNDGYTQPIVTWPVDSGVEVIDGFHRSRVGKESIVVKDRVKGYLPIVKIREEQTGKNDRVASTIRHNRARGKHQIDAMSEIIIELKNRNWKNTRIARELGMDEDEILRLCQISGLENLFSDNDFSSAWESADSVDDDFEELTDDIDDINIIRIPREKDESRIMHTYDKWECYKAGFFASTKEGMKKEECELAYAEFLSNEERFRNALKRVITEWQFSCEHYLTNQAMNRIAWMGQASMCIDNGMPSVYCSGYNLLTSEQQQKADLIALEYINEWMRNNNREELDIDEALSLGRQVEIY